MKYRTTCDMGNIKIYNNGMSCFFSNNIGDVPNIVEIYDKKIIAGINVNLLDRKRSNAEFLGHFTVKTNAYLSAYDCSDEPIYTFKKGRWFVYLLETAHFHIEKVDLDIYA